MQTAERFRGLLLGTAVGDSLGLPAEGLSRDRVKKLYAGQWRHRFFFHKGMVSDDTEHAFFTGQCLLAHPRSSHDFIRRLAWTLRFWLVGLPAGIGFATLRSIVLLWLGFSPDRSGVCSAGNGPAMRSPIIGAFFSHDPEQMEAYVARSTLITHTDPKALTGARAVARLAAWVIERDLSGKPLPYEMISLLRSCGDADVEWLSILRDMAQACREAVPVSGYADRLGLHKGVTGYMYHTVPVAVYAWYRHFGNFEDTVTAVLNCGGDTDTAGAVAGALAGAVTGVQGIPRTWIDDLWEWPRTMETLTALSDRLAMAKETSQPQERVRYFWPGVLFRNAWFLTVVLFHGVVRMASFR